MRPFKAGRQTVPEAFAAAFVGIGDFVRERNSRIQIGVAGLAILISGVLRLSPAEWAVIVVCIFAVLSLEAMNCAVERVVDLASPDYHELARQAKDLAAGAVLIASVGSVAVGLILFVPRVIALARLWE